MNKIEKTKVIEDLVEKLEKNNNFYLADTSSMSSAKTSKMRRMCYDKKISMLVVKNSLLKKEAERNKHSILFLFDAAVGKFYYFASETHVCCATPVRPASQAWAPCAAATPVAQHACSR